MFPNVPVGQGHYLLSVQGAQPPAGAGLRSHQAVDGMHMVPLVGLAF